MKRWTNIVRVIIAVGLFGWLCLSATEVYANTIICGKQLCTVGEKNDNGIYQRICWEIKNKNRGKCDYKCQGFGEVPSDCKKKDKYECKRYAKSQQNCSAANGGRSIDPNNKPYEYRNYREASYTKYEKNNMPKCENVAAGSTLCMCHESWKGDVVCKAGQICKRSEMVQTHLETGTGAVVDFYCQNKEAAIAGGNSSMTTSNSVAATDGYDVQSQIDANTDDYGVDNDCRTVAQLQERYTSGCWSCLVVGKLTEAFLRVAQAGLEISKEAGLKLLFLGFILWLVFWALKNVSSFTEVKGGNILNDLLKTCAKVVIAYFCINAGAVAIRNYVVTPIMGVGATMAQYFWSQNTSVNATGKSVKDYTEDFEWDFSEEDLEELRLEAQETINGEIVNSTDESLTEDERAENEAINQENRERFARSQIPNFLIPGVLNGNLSSPAGPRKVENGSSCHAGVDIGLGCTGNPQRNGCQPPGCVPYVAAGPGTLIYRRSNGVGNGAGFTAEIDHGKIGGHTWKTRYFHMRPGTSEKFGKKPQGVTYHVEQGEKIGCLGQSGGKNYPKTKLYPVHGHFEVLYDGKNVDPMMLPSKHIVYIDDLCRCGCRNNEKSNCPAAGKGTYTVFREGKAVGTGWTVEGEGVVLPSGYESNQGEEIITPIPEFKFEGGSAIIPSSVLNSMLGATKSITDTTAQLMVLGNMAMCYSNMAGGGAWAINLLGDAVYITNIFMWLDGAILWILGFVLTCIVAYYLIDISFKLGLAVLALPIVMGLWPYKITQGKLATVIAIIAKTSALFAFLALTTYYAIELIAYSLGGDSGISGIYSEYDSIINHTVSGDERDEVIAALDDHFQLFSANFVLMLFGCIYGFKLIRKTTDDLVEKFYPDSVFKGQNPMHSKATAIAGMANKLNQKWGTGLVKDIAANKVGKGVTKLGGKGLRAASNVTRSIAGGTKKLLGSGKGGSRP